MTPAGANGEIMETGKDETIRCVKAAIEKLENPVMEESVSIMKKIHPDHGNRPPVRTYDGSGRLPSGEKLDR